MEFVKVWVVTGNEEMENRRNYGSKSRRNEESASEGKLSVRK